MKISVSSNRILALILGLFSIGYLIMAIQIPSFSLPTPVDSDLFPKVLGISLLLLSIFLFFEKENKEEEQKNKEDATEEQESKEANEEQHTIDERLTQKANQTVFIVVCAIGLYIFLFEILGFLLSTFLFTFIMTYFFGYRRHWVNGTVALLIAMVLYFGMTKGLDIYLPQGWIPL
jgi:putative tricarboxylic transport membrane protein